MFNSKQAILLLPVVLQLLCAQASQANCVSAFGINHCSLGGASVSNNAGKVQVSGTNSITDGVQSNFSSATAWSTNLQFSSMESLKISASNVSLSSNLSTLDLSINGQGYPQIVSSFASGQCTVSVLDANDNVVGQQTGSPQSMNARPVINVAPILIQFSSNPAAGDTSVYVWKIKLPADQSILLPNNLAYTGRSIVFTSSPQTNAAGFDTVDLTGSVSSLVKISETTP